MASEKFTGKAGRKTNRIDGTSHVSIQNDVCDYLTDLTHTLRLMSCVLIAAAGALRNQNADADTDIALVLQRCCSDRLQTELEHAEGLLARLGRSMSSIDASLEPERVN